MYDRSRVTYITLYSQVIHIIVREYVFDSKDSFSSVWIINTRCSVNRV